MGTLLGTGVSGGLLRRLMLILETGRLAVNC